MPDFPGANTEYTEADYIVLSAPLDISTSFSPGTRFGPREIRHYAASFEDYDPRTDQHFSDLRVHDQGEVRPWNPVPEYLDHLTGVLRDAVSNQSKPVLLGGEHTVSIAGVRATEPDIYVCLDAHLDLRREFDGAPWSHATVTHHVTNYVTEVVVIGARSGSKPEWDRAANGDVTVVAPEAVSEWTPPFSSEDSVYLSVDIDVVDPGSAPATGTPEPYGLTSHQVRSVIRALAPFATGFDLVEVNDSDSGQTATLGAKLVREFVYTHANSATNTR